MIEIIELTLDEFMEKFPQYQIETEYPIRYFILLNNYWEVGLFIIEEIEDGVAQVSLTIFKEYRFKTLFKDTLLKIANFPFSLGFKKVITWTKRKSWIKLFKSLHEEGIMEMEYRVTHDPDETKVWFEKVARG